MIARKKPRIFYGWLIVGASFFISLYSGGVVQYGFTALFDPLANELGWSYTQISFAASLRSVEMALLAPVVGFLVDRWGPRKMIFGSAFITGFGLMLLNRVNSLAVFYVAFVFVGIGMSACSTTVIMAAVAHWFRKKIGIASGIAICGFGVGGLLVPLIVKLMDLYGWRTAIAIFGIGMIVIVAPLALLLRQDPEQYGYLPDGEQFPSDAPATQLKSALEVHVSAWSALKTRTFWHIQVSLICQMLVMSAMNVHVMPYLGSVGLDRATSALAAGAVPVLSVIGRLAFGWIADKFDKRQVAAGTFLMMGLGMFCFSFVSSSAMWLLFPFFLMYSSGLGGGRVLIAPLVREYFGRKNFGSITGLINGFNVLGTLFGPIIAAWAYDTWGSYQQIWLLFAVLSIAALFVMATAPALPKNYTTPA